MFKNLTLTQRISAGFMLVILMMLAITFMVYQQAADNLENIAAQEMVTVRDLKSDEIERYFQLMGDQAEMIAEIPLVQESMLQLPAAFQGLQVEGVEVDKSIAASLGQFYREQFLPQYTKGSGNQRASAYDLMPEAPQARLLQNLYLASNPYEAGERWRMGDAGDGSEYSRIHATLHPLLSSYQQRFGYYDIFLVAPEGDMLYSVFKEVDFSTNLNRGPWRNSGLGNLFRKVVEHVAKGADAVLYEDISRYGPSYGAPASFVAAPIVVEDGSLLGVVMMQFPLNRIDQIMRPKAELGESFETILISSDDLLLRSNSRFIEGQSRLRQRVDTAATRGSKSGESGIKRIVDYVGNESIIVHKPLSLSGLNWSLNAKISTEEVDAPARSLLRMMMVADGVAVLIAISITWLLVRVINRRTRMITDRARQLAVGTIIVEEEEEEEEEEEARDELTVIEESMYQINNAFRQVIEISNSIAIGNLEQRLKRRSDQDPLVDAINQMADNGEEVVRIANVIASGDLTAEITPRSDQDQLGIAMHQMAVNLRLAEDQATRRNWIDGGVAAINETVRGEQQSSALASAVIIRICEYLGAAVGALYLRQDLDAEGDDASTEPELRLLGSYAYSERKNLSNRYKWGEGVVGQAALEAALSR